MDLADWHLWYKRRGGRQLRTLLMEHWDPIGVHGVAEAADEYDTYAGRVANCLRSRGGAEQVAAILNAGRTEWMGFRADPQSDAAVADLIVAWYAKSMQAEASAGPT